MALNEEQFSKLINDSKLSIAQGRNRGTYGEGSISAARDAFKNIERLRDSGDLTQDQYIDIGSRLKNEIEPFYRGLLQGGSRSASAANAAGASELDTKILKDFEIYKQGKELLGRDLTKNEFSQLAPIYGSGTPREVEAGRAALAQYAEQQKNTPEALEKKYQAGAGQYGGQVNQVFNELLKRGASQAEMDHFGKELASGNLDLYTLNQFVTQLPEYRQNEATALQIQQAQEDEAARKALDRELGQYDQDFFKKAQENVLSRYSQAGLQNSSALDIALTDLMGQIQKERSAYLTDVARRDYESARGAKREDYLQNKGLLREDYLSNLNRMFGNQDYGRARGDQLSDFYRDRGYGVADYTTQQRDLERLLNSYNSRQGSDPYAKIGRATIGGLAGIPFGPIGIATGAGFGYLGG